MGKVLFYQNKFMYTYILLAITFREKKENGNEVGSADLRQALGIIGRIMSEDFPLAPSAG